MENLKEGNFVSGGVLFMGGGSSLSNVRNELHKALEDNIAVKEISLNIEDLSYIYHANRSYSMARESDGIYKLFGLPVKERR